MSTLIFDNPNSASIRPRETEIAIDISDTVRVGTSPLIRKERLRCPTVLAGETANQPQL